MAKSMFSLNFMGFSLEMSPLMSKRSLYALLGIVIVQHLKSSLMTIVVLVLYLYETWLIAFKWECKLLKWPFSFLRCQRGKLLLGYVFAKMYLSLQSLQISMLSESRSYLQYNHIESDKNLISQQTDCR